MKKYKRINKIDLILRQGLICFLLTLPFFVFADSDDVNKEYQIKAAYLYNILKFVDWPDAKNNFPLVLCVYGENPFGELLKPIEKRTVSNRTIKVAYIIDTSATACDVIFIGSTSETEIKRVTTNFNGRGILTVGDQPKFTELGGIIGFVNYNGTIRYKLNMTRAKASGLMINSQLTDTALEVQ